MNGAKDPAGPVDEFDWIERCLRPLAAHTPEALGLLDDAAVLPSRPGFDLIVTKDAIVEGVHFLPTDPLDLVARKLLRVNLSDLAAKGAAPYGYLLAIAWPGERDGSARRAFAEGLRADQRAFNLALFGGDTVSTPGPLIASATLMGWVPSGRMVRRSGARIGDRVLVTGTIGDGALGLVAARGDGLGLSAEHEAFLKGRYQTPRPRLGLGEDLRRWAHAAADVSDGLVADLGHIAEASGVRIVLELDRTPLSEAGARWLAGQSSRSSALAQLATGGDDYEIVCTAPPQAVEPLRAAALAAGFTLTDIGEAQAGAGVAVRSDGLDLKLQHTGWRHGQ